MENKCDRTIQKEDLDLGMEYTIKGMKCVITKYRRKIVIITDFKSKIVYLFALKRFNSKAARYHFKDY